MFYSNFWQDAKAVPDPLCPTSPLFTLVHRQIDGPNGLSIMSDWMIIPQLSHFLEVRSIIYSFFPMMRKRNNDRLTHLSLRKAETASWMLCWYLRSGSKAYIILVIYNKSYRIFASNRDHWYKWNHLRHSPRIIWLTSSVVTQRSSANWRAQWPIKTSIWPNIGQGLRDHLVKLQKTFKKRDLDLI
jgi:hypothetical protein